MIECFSSLDVDEPRLGGVALLPSRGSRLLEVGAGALAFRKLRQCLLREPRPQRPEVAELRVFRGLGFPELLGKLRILIEQLQPLGFVLLLEESVELNLELLQVLVGLGELRFRVLRFGLSLVALLGNLVDFLLGQVVLTLFFRIE